MNNYGVIINETQVLVSYLFTFSNTFLQILLDELGFDENFMVQLRKICFEPLCHLLFPELSSNGFDSHKVFTVDYAEDKDTSLNFHFDNSEVLVVRH